ncbi:cytochrome C oxidase subunit II [Paenibacillus harenae]|uniref:Cytochrome c oxidase subunit 2 n=1 Tax=Paenibacillus harenae TaxID=306543 RepID=A0ABT9TWT2_PAEHA|nr:cytochrome C oxidase subunit II [Paenibacillus harenae]MDQ0058481.1 cytochrome c oxidase subunit 2 [Paenibacillus harenae]MDQ0111823.1 cytochrome c oxidase subunit 2 [Paenibacillus harenae]
MHKWIMFVLFTAASLLGVYMLTFGLPAKPVDEAAGLPEGVSLMKVVASNDFTFDQDTYTVKVGDKVKLKLENKSGIHGVHIDELQVELDNDHPETDLEFTEPGEYRIYCSIPCGQGHTTMEAKLIVEAA